MAKAGGSRIEEVFIKTNSNILLNGKVYVVSEPFLIQKLNFTMKAGFCLKECCDGMFRPYDEKDNKIFFRVGEDIIKENINYLKT